MRQGAEDRMAMRPNTCGEPPSNQNRHVTVKPAGLSCVPSTTTAAFSRRTRIAVALADDIGVFSSANRIV